MNYELPALDDRFDIGRVVGRAFSVFTANAPLFIGLTFLLSGVPNLLTGVISAQVLASQDQSGPGVLLGIAQLLTVLIGLVTYYVASATITHATVLEVDGQKPAFGDALKTGLRFALPLLLTSMAAGLGLMIGFILLIIPGIILAIMWSLVVPVMVVENLGVSDSFARSGALTKGARWRMLALLSVGLLLLAVPTLAAGFVTGVLEDSLAGVNPGLTPGVVVQAAVGSVANALFITIIASAYIELRAIKDGTSSEALAGIFS